MPAIGPPPVLTAVQATLLLRSLQQFQLGETGEGRIAHQIDHVRWRGVDDDLRAIVKLWVREEGRHARIVGLMVNAMGGAVLGRHWSAKLFEVGRRALGVRWKMLVALAAEVGAVAFYSLLAGALRGSSFGSAFEQLTDDERGHQEFQTELFARASNAPARMLVLVAWILFGGAACFVLFMQHARTLAALGVPRMTTVRTLASCWSRTAYDLTALRSRRDRYSEA